MKICILVDYAFNRRPNFSIGSVDTVVFVWFDDAKNKK